MFRFGFAGLAAGGTERIIYTDNILMAQSNDQNIVMRDVQEAITVQDMAETIFVIDDEDMAEIDMNSETLAITDQPDRIV